jgi:hypothetical protein
MPHGEGKVPDTAGVYAKKTLRINTLYNGIPLALSIAFDRQGGDRKQVFIIIR